MQEARRKAILALIEREMAAHSLSGGGGAGDPGDERACDELGTLIRDTCAWDDHDVEQIVKACLPVQEMDGDDIRRSLEKIFADRVVRL